MAGRYTWFVLCLASVVSPAWGQEPPTIDPFGPRKNTREDALPGYVELSDGSVQLGQVYLTRDAKLKVFDEKENRQREIPLRVVQRIECTVIKEWMEKEWRFKENANDEKVYTGHSYPSREYVHTLTLTNGKTIRGPLSGIVYVQKAGEDEPTRHLLHKRDKGPIDSDLKALVYVRRIELGDKALEEGKRKTAKQAKDKR
jgi:hypothetical protein